MPHLIVEYSANLAEDADMTEFCAAMRDAMASTGVFPLGGIRVRAYAADAWAVSDGGEGNAFAAMSLRIGRGRDAGTRAQALEAVYSAAEAWLKPKVGDRPFALNLEMFEIDPDASEKRWNTLHAALKPEAGAS